MSNIVAILVPTKNRPDFILRMLSYYNLTNSSHPILIGDASDLTTSKKIRDIINEFKNLEVKYFHWENVGCNQTIYRLTNEASKNYDYAAQQGDDDFFIPSSLSKCALFLSNNPDYRTAQGRAAYIRLDRPGAFGRIEYAGQQWGSREYKQDKSTQRFLTLFKNYSAYDFCTHRTNEYLQDSDYYFKIEDIILGEIFRSYMFAIRGKSKFIDCLYSVFHFHTQHHVSQNPVKWIFQENFRKFHKNFRNFKKITYEKPKNTYRILCIGGSIFYGPGVNNNETR